jgi:hypothetical protein
VNRPGGRTTVGASNHCAHGKDLNVETILDWRPFQYVTSEQVNGAKVMRQTVMFEPTADGKGTHVSYYLMPPKMPLPRAIVGSVFNFIMYKIFKYPQAVENAARMLPADRHRHENDETSEAVQAEDHAAH